MLKLFHCQKRVARFFLKKGNPFSHPEAPKSSQNSVIWSVSRCSSSLSSLSSSFSFCSFPSSSSSSSSCGGGMWWWLGLWMMVGLGGIKGYNVCLIGLGDSFPTPLKCCMAIPKEPGTNLFYDELFKWWNVRLKAAVVIELPDSGDESTDLSSVLTCVKGEEETPDSLESQLLEDPYLDGLVVESIPISPEPSSPEPPLSYVDALAAVVGEVGDDVEETKEAVEEPPKNAAAEYLQDVAPKAPDCPDLSSHETQKPICSILKLKGQDLHTLPVAVIEARIAFLKYFSCSYRTL